MGNIDKNLGQRLQNIGLMAKQKQLSLRDSYREIMAASGKNIDDYKVIAFEFDDVVGPNFHYVLMDHHCQYELFDGPGKIVTIVITKDAELEQRIVDLAAKYGGQKITPFIR